MANSDDVPYPQHPGAKSHGTSELAAERLTNHAATLRKLVLGVLAGGPTSADRCAAILNKSVLAVRPRFSELVKAGLIVKTGDSQVNESGMRANVYRLKERDSEAPKP